MKNTIFSLLLLAIGATFLFTNCASLTGFQTGRTVGQNNGEFMASINYSQTPDFNLDIDQNDTSDISRLGFPNIELGGRFGLTEELDMGIKVNTTLNFALDAKYQLLGDKESEVALSVGAGIGSFGFLGALWNVQVPLYFSFHPNESVDIYVTPRYIRQFSTGDLGLAKLNYLGGNAGVLFGTKVKFGFDLGIYNLSADKTNALPISTFGFGVKVPIQ